MEAQTITGTWEEICAQKSDFAGHRLSVTALPDKNVETLEDIVAVLKNRTPEEIAEVRERVLRTSPPPRELPPGKNLVDRVTGRWPGNETDEEIATALRKLS